MRKIHLEIDVGTPSSNTKINPGNSSDPWQTISPNRKSTLLSDVAQNRFIMVIDDSSTIRKIVEVCLRREGFEVESYPDGVEALRTFTNDPQKRIPDLLVLDIDLPKMNGYNVARYLRTKPQWSQTVIVILSRHTGIIEQLKARLAGTQAYLTKPFTTGMIIEVVTSHLGLSSASIG